MTLIAATDFEGLPEEPEVRWLRLRDLVERRLDSRFDINNGGNETYELLEYVHVLSAVAEELKIGDLPEISLGNVREEFDGFRAVVAALATRLSLRASTTKSGYYVAIGRPTRKLILSEIENLRVAVKNSELSFSHKEKVARQIDKLQVLVIAPRTDIASATVALATIGGLALGTTAFLADLPAAVGTITALLGSEKIEQDEDQRLIEGARQTLQIEDLRENPPGDRGEGFGYGADDEIPF